MNVKLDCFTRYLLVLSLICCLGVWYVFLSVLCLDLSIQAGGLNMGWVYSSLGKIQAAIFRLYGFWINSTGLERPCLAYVSSYQS